MKTSCLLMVAVFAFAGCKREKEAAKEEHGHSEGHEGHHDGGEEGMRVHIDPEMLRDLRVTTAPVEARTGGEGVTVLGELSVNENAYAEIATPVAARVLAVLVTTGDSVSAGRPLIRLQSPELGKARASLQAAQARASAARAAAERKRSLAAERIVSERDVQSTEADAAAAEADLAAARSALAALGVDSAKGAEPVGPSSLTLRSPVPGTVIERKAVVGQMAEPSQTLLRVGDLSRLWLTVHAFERDAVRVKPGVEARLSFAAFPGRSFTAKVLLVGAEVDGSSRTVPVRIEVENLDGTLKPGMSASAFLPLGEKGEIITTVPAAALQRLENGWYVFLPTEEAGAFERREVGRGRSLGGEVEVLSGLTKDERVVVEGAFLLKAEFDKSKGEGEHHEH